MDQFFGFIQKETQIQGKIASKAIEAAEIAKASETDVWSVHVCKYLDKKRNRCVAECETLVAILSMVKSMCGKKNNMYSTQVDGYGSP